MAAKKPEFLYAICAACTVCAQVCPLTCIEMTKTDYDAMKKAYPVLAAEDRCTACGICKRACPVEAIR